jgi:hypothetical protein
LAERVVVTVAERRPAIYFVPSHKREVRKFRNRLSSRERLEIRSRLLQMKPASQRMFASPRAAALFAIGMSAVAYLVAGSLADAWLMILWTLFMVGVLHRSERKNAPPRERGASMTSLQYVADALEWNSLVYCYRCDETYLDDREGRVSNLRAKAQPMQHEALLGRRGGRGHGP